MQDACQGRGLGGRSDILGGRGGFEWGWLTFGSV